MKKSFELLKKWWMAFAQTVGWFNTRLLLTIFYVIIIGLPAIFLKLFRKDLLDRKIARHQADGQGGRLSYWVEKEKVEHTLETARHQF